jgi:hypothetical protein
MSVGDSRGCNYSNSRIAMIGQHSSRSLRRTNSTTCFEPARKQRVRHIQRNDSPKGRLLSPGTMVFEGVGAILRWRRLPPLDILSGWQITA